MAHPKPYLSEYESKYPEPEFIESLPLEQKVAGVSSLASMATREPAFTHKRRIGLQGTARDHVMRALDFNGEKMNLENRALRFKTGMRRSTDKWPTEYNLQYGWKNPAASAPLLKAQEALSQQHHPVCPNNKPAEQDLNVESIDGREGTPESDQPEEQQPKRPATAPMKKQHCRKQKAVSQRIHRQLTGVPEDPGLNKQPGRHIVPVKAKGGPQLKTRIIATEQEDESLGSDTDSQTGQKVQQQRGAHHHLCEHKKKKKRHVKRKLIWPMVTEYRSQYKSRELPATTTDAENDKPPAGSPQKLVDNSDPRLLKHSPMKLFKLQPERVKITSEYLANYLPPTKVRYKEGAWNGASPPHLLPQACNWTNTNGDGDDNDARSDSTTGDWFNQVLELRRLASSYRRRAEGTHFVQVHLADMEGEDDTEEASSTVSSCSVCRHQQPPVAPPTRSHDPAPPFTNSLARAPPTKPHDIAPPTESHDPQDDTDSNSSAPTSSVHRSTEPPTGQVLPEDEEGLHGRLPTPELKQIPPARKIRHHLDRTTPCKGAILTSPPKDVRHGWNPEEDDEEEEENPLTETTMPPGVTKTLPSYRRDMTSRAPVYPSHTTPVASQHEKHPNFTTRKKQGGTGTRKTIIKQPRNLHSTQTQVPNRRTAPNTVPNRRVRHNEDDDMECSFCGSPLRRPTAQTNTRLTTDNRPLATHKISTTTATLSAPQKLKTTQFPSRQHLTQQQPLSGSQLSLSSCSVASEVLQRAQHRKATFWNQKQTTAT